MRKKKNRRRISLTQKKCRPCEGGVLPISRREAKLLLNAVPGWRLSRGARVLHTEYRMKDFMAAVRFVQRIARLAESENHHPDIHLTGYRKLSIELSTHAIGGLSENDFILAAKMNELPKQLVLG